MQAKRGGTLPAVWSEERVLVTSRWRRDRQGRWYAIDMRHPQIPAL
jgi:hypothetical protein